MQQTRLQNRFYQRRFDCARENKRKELFAESGKFDLSAKHATGRLAYDTYYRCLKSIVWFRY
jgi:hypothetical protein